MLGSEGSLNHEYMTGAGLLKARRHKTLIGPTVAVTPRPAGLSSARHLAEHLARPVFPQFRHLSRDALAVRRYPRIAVNHGFILHQNSAPKKRNRFNGLILVHNS